jgi:hypothetical protein
MQLLWIIFGPKTVSISICVCVINAAFVDNLWTENSKYLYTY